MPGGNLVVLLGEDLDLTEGALCFALELSKRLESKLAILLVAGADGDRETRPVGRLEASARAAARDHGIEVETLDRRGDPASELLKFLASRPAVRAVVWSGDESALRAVRGSRSGQHWLGRLRRQIACPIVTATGRKARRARDPR